ncbi:LysR family transcriptional regulator [Marinomonas colpomeniae]|uniref:LysR family transcriptional regulator n=1 Tax=Marinomonas colpomeniae TaxID=2774408 RepID=A0ABR8P5A4_9GAMM|nr:LysR family transcriptional regulator [Marinomonas colpomeniae]MBD5772327.1 LysR family transcriptional regulator [Marinomonas colpomeniae]
MINPLWLRTFCTLVDISHFTRTAEHLNMTQSGVSQQVRKLEDLLGQALLIRKGKQFTLTDAGERLYKEGGELLGRLSELEMSIGDDPAYEGSVRVVSPGSVGLKLYTQLLLLQKKYPKLVIDYRFASNHEVERLVAENKVDLGFMTRPSTLGDVHVKPIATEELLLITPHNIQSSSWKQLQTLGFIDHPDGAHHASLLLGANYVEFEHDEAFKRSGFCNQITLILDPVGSGLGFTVLPRHAVSAYGKPENIFIHQLATPVSETLYLARLRNKRLTNRQQTVIEVAEQCLM